MTDPTTLLALRDRVAKGPEGVMLGLFMPPADATGLAAARARSRLLALINALIAQEADRG